MWVGVLIVLGGLWFDRLCVRVALGCLIVLLSWFLAVLFLGWGLAGWFGFGGFGFVWIIVEIWICLVLS